MHFVRFQSPYALTETSVTAVVSMAVKTQFPVSGHGCGSGRVMAKKAFWKWKRSPLQTKRL